MYTADFLASVHHSLCAIKAESIHAIQRHPSMSMPSLFGIDSISFIARFLESLSQRRDHSPEPIDVQNAQRRVAHDICYREPRRYRQASRRLKRSPDVLIHPQALIGAPDQATRSKSRNERDAIHELHH